MADDVEAEEGFITQDAAAVCSELGGGRTPARHSRCTCRSPRPPARNGDGSVHGHARCARRLNGRMAVVVSAEREHGHVRWGPPQCSQPTALCAADLRRAVSGRGAETGTDGLAITGLVLAMCSLVFFGWLCPRCTASSSRPSASTTRRTTEGTRPSRRRTVGVDPDFLCAMVAGSSRPWQRLSRGERMKATVILFAMARSSPSG